MICPHCNIGIHEKLRSHWVSGYDLTYEAEFFGSQITYMDCPACHKLIVFLTEDNAKYRPTIDGDEYFFLNEKHLKKTLIFPKFQNVSINKLVPQKYVNEFIEAANTIGISPKASATLSRRLLQMILHEELKIKKKDLDLEIQEYEKMQGVSSGLIELLQLLRQVGNYGAHPKKKDNVGEIVEIEKGEAEILLKIIEKLFDEVFIKPQLEKQSIDLLKSKFIK